LRAREAVIDAVARHPQAIALQLGDGAATNEREHAIDLFPENSDRTRSTGLAARRDPIERRAAEQHRLRAERQRLDDIAAAPEPAVNEDREALACGIDHVRQRVEPRR